MGWKPPNEIIHKAGSKLIHEIMSTSQPKRIKDLIRMPHTNSFADSFLEEIPKKARFGRFMINSSLDLYNMIPDEIRDLPHKQMKSKLKKLRLKDKKQKT